MSLTTILLRPALAPDGTAVGLDWRLRLVDIAGNRASAVRASDSTPIRGRHTGTIPADATAPLEIAVVPIPELATPGGISVWWELRILPHGADSADTDTWRLSVPVSAEPLDILDLVAASAAPADTAAALLARVAALEANQLPTDAAPGDILIYSDEAGWYATDTLPVS